MDVLTLKLKGLFQSYGSDSTFYQRKSQDYPTKSAVVGMLSACLGYRRNESSKIKKLNDSLSFAVRIDQPGTIMTDYQNAHVDGRDGANSQTWRQNIQDGVFLVAIGSDNDTIQTIIDGLNHPYFYPTLGRRSNLPAGPLEYKVYNDTNILDVLGTVNWQADDWYADNHYLSTLDVYGDNDVIESETRPFIATDNVVSFDSKRRQFAPRLINKQVIVNPTEGEPIDNFWATI